MNKSRIMRYVLGILLGVFAMLFGVFMFVYGELDDSPGGQLLGLLVAIAGSVGVIKAKRKMLTKPDSNISNQKES